MIVDNINIIDEKYYYTEENGSLKYLDGLVENSITRPLIIIIYSTKQNNLRADEKNNQDKLKNKVMFDGHYYVRTNGDIYKGRPDSIRGEFAYNRYTGADLNSNCIGICLEGDFSEDFLLYSQRDSLIQLCKYLLKKYPSIRFVNYLLEVNHDLDPGYLFPYIEVYSDIYGMLPEPVGNIGGFTEYCFGKRQLIYDPRDVMKGSDVLFLQTILYKIGLLSGGITGEYDSFTRDSVKVYQSENNLTANGVADYATLNAIEKEILNIYSENIFNRVLVYDPLDSFIEGNDVKVLQENLNLKGYKCEITTVYDEQTYKTVKRFQLDNNILSDGKVGPYTWDTVLKETDNFRTLQFVFPDFMEGPDVTSLQNKLKEKGYSVNITGKFDQITMLAVRKFQVDNNWKNIDGVVTKELMNLIFK